MKKKKNSYPSFTSGTLPATCGSSGSGDTVTSISFTNFHAEKYIIKDKKLTLIWVRKKYDRFLISVVYYYASFIWDASFW